MLRLLIVTLFTIFFGLTAAGIQANTVERVFPQAEQVSQRSEKGVHYLLPLGRVKEDRKAGRVQPSKFQRLQGDLEARTWKLSDDLVLLDAQRQVEEFLQQQNPVRLFQCESRDCGESFSWANAIFQEPVLFGADRAQFLWVIQDRNQPRYHVLYLIERPNRRIYLHEDSLLVPPGMETADQVALTLGRSGRVLLANLDIKDGKVDFTAALNRVKQWQDEVKIPLLLVLHRHGSARELTGLVEQLQQAMQAAQLKGDVADAAALAPDANATSLVWIEWVNPDWTPAGL